MKNLSIIGLLFTSLLLLQACGGEEANTERAALEQIKVKLATAQMVEVPQLSEFAGTVQASERVNLSTKLMGQITYLPVEEGQQVRKGQTLVRIKSAGLQAKKAQAQAMLTEAQAALSMATKDHARISRLFESQSATQKEMDDINAHLEMAKARVAAAEQMQREVQENLGYAEIKAPFDGYVVRKMVQSGDMANPGMPLMTVEAPAAYKVVAKVPENEVTNLQIGDEVQVSIEALENETFTAAITRINPAGDYRGGQFEVTVQLQPTTEQVRALKSGLFASVMLKKGSEQRIMLPEEALVQRGQLLGLYAVNEQGEAMLRWIKTGKRYGGQVEVLSGLAAGEQYITDYEGKIADGVPVVTN